MLAPQSTDVWSLGFSAITLAADLLFWPDRLLMTFQISVGFRLSYALFMLLNCCSMYFLWLSVCCCAKAREASSTVLRVAAVWYRLFAALAFNSASHALWTSTSSHGAFRFLEFITGTCCSAASATHSVNTVYFCLWSSRVESKREVNLLRLPPKHPSFSTAKGLAKVLDEKYDLNTDLDRS